jgi:hypothetical protein
MNVPNLKAAGYITLEVLIVDRDDGGYYVDFLENDDLYGDYMGCDEVYSDDEIYPTFEEAQNRLKGKK